MLPKHPLTSKNASTWQTSSAKASHKKDEKKTKTKKDAQDLNVVNRATKLVGKVNPKGKP